MAVRIVKIVASRVTKGVTVYYQDNKKTWTETYLNPPPHLQLSRNC